MGLHSCSPSGELDDSKFGEPMPWIGLYIAAASLLCSLLIGIDTFHGFCRRKLWFPCRFFSLNATSLTLLSVATKLPVDLNTSMPRPLEQLTKLSGTVLLCTAMGNFITSLGSMNESTLISNVVALVILVVTVILNIGMQMGTGVIYVFLPEHAIIIFFMLVLLVIFCSTALMVPTANMLLEEQYQEVDDRDSDYRDHDFEGRYDFNIARKRVMQLWMKAHTSGQYVVGHSATSTASGAFCILSALILLQAALRSLIIRSLHFCQGKSDYTWSIIFVLISQLIAIGVGNIAPAVRWLDAISFMSTRSRRESCKGELKVEKYWVHRLEEWKEKPLPSYLGNRTFWKIVHFSQNKILGAIIRVQKAAVLVSKLIGLLPVRWLSRLSSSCCKRRGCEETGLESNVDLSHFVQHLEDRFRPYLEGDVDLVQLIVNNGREDIDHWIRKGKSTQQDNLVHLLVNSQDLQGEVNFVQFRYQVPMLGTKGPPPTDYGPLLVVTLTSIAITIGQPCIEKGTIKSLQRAVNEGLRYVRLVDKNVKGWINMRRAADIVWPSIEFYDSWLGNDLTKLARREDTAETILKKLVDIGKKYFLDHTDEKDKDPHDWPPKVAAAESMYRLCETILLQKLGTPDQIFRVLQKTIADTIVCCLEILPDSECNTCFSTSIESREESIKEAANLLGELENILTKEEIKRYLKEMKKCGADVEESQPSLAKGRNEQSTRTIKKKLVLNV